MGGEGGGRGMPRNYTYSDQSFYSSQHIQKFQYIERTSMHIKSI